MKDTIIHFKKMKWDYPDEGVAQKVYSDGNRRMRLLRFKDNFVEKEWCHKGHIGLVLEGEMQIDFNGAIKNYEKGDGLWINKGEIQKHKVRIAKGKFVKLLLFESESQQQYKDEGRAW